MKYLLISNIFFIILVLTVSARNNYLWGKKAKDDVMITKDTVQKPFIMKMVVTAKYVFKQDPKIRYNITAIEVNDKKRKNGATATLTHGGPGYKDASIKFRSQPGQSINDEVRIWVNPNP